MKIKHPELKLLKWGEITNFDIVINATSVGLNFEDKIDINFKNLKDHKIFYDTIYNPPMTNFLSEAKLGGHNFLNGKLMLIYQAQKASEMMQNGDHAQAIKMFDDILNKNPYNFSTHTSKGHAQKTSYRTRPRF